MQSADVGADKTGCDPIRIVSASGAHDLELVPATALLAKTADPLCIRLNANHNIELELFE